MKANQRTFTIERIDSLEWPMSSFRCPFIRRQKESPSREIASHFGEELPRRRNGLVLSRGSIRWRLFTRRNSPGLFIKHDLVAPRIRRLPPTYRGRPACKSTHCLALFFLISERSENGSGLFSRETALKASKALRWRYLVRVYCAARHMLPSTSLSFFDNEWVFRQIVRHVSGWLPISSKFFC